MICIIQNMSSKWSVIRTVTVHILASDTRATESEANRRLHFVLLLIQRPTSHLAFSFKGFSSCSHANRELSFTLISIHKTRSRSLQEFVVTNQQYDEIYASDASFITGPKIAMDSQ